LIFFSTDETFLGNFGYKEGRVGSGGFSYTICKLMIQEIECAITGRVQMVMYRDFAARTAHKLGLRGTVENVPDGSVRVVAQGEKEVLAAFIQKLWRGSPFSKVKNVEVQWRDPRGEYKGFVIRYRNIFDRI
jgi:acylphosphatase